MQWRGKVGNLTREDWSGWAKWPPWVVSVKAAHNGVRPHLDGEDIGMKRGKDTGYRRHRQYSGGYRGYRGRGGTNKAGFPHCSFYHRALWPTKAIVPPPPFFLLCLRKTPTGAIPTNQPTQQLDILGYFLLAISFNFKFALVEPNLDKRTCVFDFSDFCRRLIHLQLPLWGKRRGRGGARWSIWVQPTNQPVTTVQVALCNQPTHPSQ